MKLLVLLMLVTTFMANAQLATKKALTLEAAKQIAAAAEAEARKNSKKQAMLARVRRHNALAYGYTDRFSGGARLFSYAPGLEHY